MATIYLGLGSNLGNRRKNIQDAISLLKDFITVEKFSTIIETEPVGFLDQRKFLNAVLKGTTELSALHLLAETKSIESKLGRIRTIRNGPRTIDIDILLYDQEKISTPKLTIPHPGMWERDFVMGPLKEIEPDMCHCEKERFSATTKQSFKVKKIASSRPKASGLAMTRKKSTV